MVEGMASFGRSFFKLIYKIVDKAALRMLAICHLISNVGGPLSSRCHLLASAVQCVLLYGSEVWADFLNRLMYGKGLSQVQRRGAPRDVFAHLAFSEPAVMLITGVVPIALHAAKQRFISPREGEGHSDALVARALSLT